MFSSMSFIVSGLTFRYLIHFEFIFVYGVRKCSSFILLQVVDQFSQHHQGEKTALRLGENNSKQSNRQRINLKNIQATPPTQLQKNK